MTTPRSRLRLAGTSTLATVLVAAAAVPALALGARDEVVRTERRTVTPGPGSTLEIDHVNGHVRVRAGARSDIAIVATFRVSGRTRESAEQVANAMRLVLTTGTTVRTRIESPEWGRSHTDVGFAVDLDVEMPARMPVTVTNRFGQTTIGGLKAPLTVNSGNGRLLVEDVEARASLRNRFGAIDVRRLTGDVEITGDNGSIVADTISGSVTVHSRFGSVTLSSVGRQATVDGMNGAIVIRDVRGGVTVSSNFGPVQMERIGGRVAIKAGNGNVRVLGIGGGASVETRFGSVALRDVTGPVDVRGTNGGIDVSLSGKTCEPASLTTSFGPLVVYPGTGGYALTASAGFGRITSEIPVGTTGTLTQQPGRPGTVTGTIGDGRCPLTLSNRNGNITIKAGPAPVPAAVVHDGFTRRGPGGASIILIQPGTAPQPAAAPAPPEPQATPRAPRPERAPRAPVPPGSLPQPAPAPTRP